MEAADSRNWLLTLAYDGTDFAGWQVQPDQETVQSLLDRKLERLFRSPVRTFATSRTDAGVHALGQRVTCHLPATPPIPTGRALLALNTALRPSVRVLAIEEKPPGFHARHAALGKAYTYLIYRGRPPAPFVNRYVWALHQPLDTAAMRQAAATLVGTHNFTAFGANSGSPENERDPVKTIHACTLTEVGPVLMITVVGNSFLYRMVRRLTGFLAAVGVGRLPPDAAPVLFVSGNRNACFETAQPQGLFLDRVFYEEAPMLSFQRTTLPFLDELQPPPEPPVPATGVTS